MKLSSTFIAQILVLSISAQQQQQQQQQRILPLLLPKALAPNHNGIDINNEQQIPLILPDPIDTTMPTDETTTTAGGPGKGSVLLSDMMGRDRSVNAFAGFARDVAGVAARLDSASENSTVLAPLNSAIDKLPGKPWEDPRDYNALGASVYEGDEGRDRAHRNIRRFVEAHVVPRSPWAEGERARSMLDGDKEIWWERKDGVMMLQPDGIEIQSVGTTVGNGEVWIIKAVRDYS